MVIFVEQGRDVEVGDGRKSKLLAGGSVGLEEGRQRRTMGIAKNSCGRDEVSTVRRCSLMSSEEGIKQQTRQMAKVQGVDVVPLITVEGGEVPTSQGGGCDEALAQDVNSNGSELMSALILSCKETSRPKKEQFRESADGEVERC